MRTLGLAGVLGLALAGCGSVEGQVIDTWPIGPAYACQDDGPARSCDGLVRAGLAGLAARDGKHADVVETQLHREGDGQVLMTRSGGSWSVLVVRLADGTTRAIGVAYPGISQEPVAIPWETVPGSEDP